MGNRNDVLYFYMGRAHQSQYQYLQASYFYKQYLKNNKANDKYYGLALLELKNCLESSMQLKDVQSEMLVQAFENSVNTPHDEILPVQSPSFGNQFYYSSNESEKEFRPFQTIIDDEGIWEKTDFENLHMEELGTTDIQDISYDGKALLLRKHSSKNNQNNYYLVVKDSDEKEYVTALPSDIFSSAIDLQIVNHNTIAFASSQLKGHGGSDIFTTEYINGFWTKPVNAGENVNSPFDERSPFMSFDKKKIYFSSNRPYGHGGFDFYLSSDLVSSAAMNLGSQINSPDHELYLKLDNTGHMGVFASDRQLRPGGFDLFFVYFSDFPSMKPDSMPPFNAFNLPTPEQNVSVKPPEKLPEQRLVFNKSDNTSAFRLYYEDSYDLVNQLNEYKLKSIAEDYRDTSFRFNIMVHTDVDEPGLEEYVQYNCFKRAQTIANKLIELGIERKRITIESMADNFPFLKESKAQMTDTSLTISNKRVEIFIYNTEDTIVNVEELQSEIAKHPVRDNKYQVFRSIHDGIYFSVRIAQTHRIFKNAVLRYYNDVFVRQEPGSDLLDYYAGIYTQFEDALSLYRTIEENTQLEADIVSFYKGRKLDPKELERMGTRFIALEKLIEYNQDK
jgi:outer membrane protein OmpA-like peptidoglycan-associated protein